MSADIATGIKTAVSKTNGDMANRESSLVGRGGVRRGRIVIVPKIRGRCNRIFILFGEEPKATAVNSY